MLFKKKTRIKFLSKKAEDFYHTLKQADNTSNYDSQETVTSLSPLTIEITYKTPIQRKIVNAYVENLFRDNIILKGVDYELEVY